MQARTTKVKDENQPDSSDITTREQLLIAAGELMTARGSTDVSLSDIAQKSGLNSALVKYYFGNKSGLLMALLRKVLGPSMEQLRQLTSMPLAPQVKLRIHISGMVNSYFRYPYVNNLMHQMLAENADLYGPLIAEEFSKPVAEAQKIILEEGVKAGCFRPVDPLLFYFHLVGACDQLFFGRYQLKHVFNVRHVDEHLKRLYVDHLYGIIVNGIIVGGEKGAGNS
jgi:TetR/AcrR family transcriptional regulator